MWFTLLLACSPMRKVNIIATCIVCVFSSSCSPRDFLTRRLAADLIAQSSLFRAPQQFQLQTGVVNNQDYPSSSYAALQHRGWISAASVNCPPAVAPPPCWELTLTPAGVDTIQNLIAPGEAEKRSFGFPVARRELIAISGISKRWGAADVEFTWKWVPLNEVGAALYSSEAHYRSVVAFRDYDDGWRVVEKASQLGEPLEQAIEDAQPTE
jgi:hypothetical protein